MNGPQLVKMMEDLLKLARHGLEGGRESTQLSHHAMWLASDVFQELIRANNLDGKRDQNK